MSYQHPVGQPEDPYERYRVERIEADKKTKDEPAKLPERKEEPRSAVAAYLLLIFYRFLDMFEDTTEKGIATHAEKEIRDNLTLIKDAFDVLKREDRSQDAPYLNLLSDLWHKALEDTVRFRRDTKLALQFKAFIREVDTYPPGQEYSFGYYLTEYAGQKWLPFPYMELVKKIHDDYEKSPSSSALSHWTKLLDELIKKMLPN